MADITSSTYSVTTESKTGDLYAIVRDGQLRKQTVDAVASVAVAGAVAELRLAGNTANRPVAPTVGTMYFDTTLNQPIWWSGFAWVDADGVAS